MPELLLKSGAALLVDDEIEKTGIHELSGVDPVRISIVDVGANGQTYFMRKRGAGDGIEFDLPGVDLIAKSDWSAVYCVVAAPGQLEQAGLYGDQSIPDRWASEDEIRDACHRFAKNGGVLNRMHEDDTPCAQLVENAIAPATFSVTGPDGVEHTITKGSWYVAFEPNAAERAAIEDGTYTGVSLEGKGLRKLVAKATPAERKPTGDRLDGVGNRITRALTRAIAKRSGLTDAEIDAIEAAELAKGQPTFAERMAQRDFEDELPQAFDVLRDAVWSAFYPYPDDDDAEAPKTLIERSLDEFKAWAIDLLERVPAADIAKQLDDPAERIETSGSFDGMDEAEIDALAEKISEGIAKALPAAIEKAAESPEPGETGEPGGEDQPTLADVAKSVADLGTKLEGVDQRVTALGAGGATGTTPADEDLGKSGAKPHDGII